MQVIPIENKLISNFAPEFQEILKQYFSTPATNTTEHLHHIYNSCEENLDAVTRLIQHEIPTDIITLPTFIIERDDFLDAFVVKSKHDQPMLEAAITIAICKTHKNLRDTHKVLGYLMAMGHRLLPGHRYQKVLDTVDGMSKLKESLGTLENKVSVIQEHAVTEEMLDAILAKYPERFKEFVAYIKESMLSDKEFQSYIAVDIEPYLAKTNDSINGINARIGALQRILDSAVMREKLMVPGTDAFNQLLDCFKKFLMEDKKFRDFIAKAIEMETKDTLHEVRDKLALFDQKSAE